MTTESERLLATVDSMRLKKFPTLPASLLEQIVHVEVRFPDDDRLALEKIEQLVMSYLEQVKSSGGAGA